MRTELVERPEGRDHMGDLGVDGRIIMIQMFKAWDGEIWTGLYWIRIGTGGGLL